MRPDVDEQLRPVSPASSSEWSRPRSPTPTRPTCSPGSPRVLDGIANGWADVAAFLDWDARETLALLVDATPGVDADVADEARTLAAEPPDAARRTRARRAPHAVRGLLASWRAALPEGEPADVSPHTCAPGGPLPHPHRQRMPGQR